MNGALEMVRTGRVVPGLFALVLFAGPMDRVWAAGPAGDEARAGSASTRLAALPPGPDAVPSPAEPYAHTPPELLPFTNLVEPHVWFFPPHQFYLPRTFDPEEAPGQEVRIGLMAYDVTSPWVRLSTQLERGATLAIEEANRRGGYKGLPYRLAIERTLPVWGAASNAAVNLAYRHKVVAFLGPTDPVDSHIALRVTLKTGVPMITTVCTDHTQTETKIPWYLRVCSDDRQYGYALAMHVVKRMGVERIGVMRVNGMYGRFGVVKFIDSCRRLHRPVVTEMRFKQGSRTFDSQIELLRGQNLGALVLWGDAEDTAHFVKAARLRGLTMPILGSDRLVDSKFLEIAGKAAEEMILVTDYDPTRKDPELTRFLRAYQNRFGEPASQIAARTYAGARLLLDVIDRAGPYRHKIQEEMMAFEGRSVRTIIGTVTFDPRLDNLMPVCFVRVKDGRFEYHGATPPAR